MENTSQAQPTSAIPTNIITGFLGVGKTTVIFNLLQQKPPSERWAILVNEFGEIGVDGSFFEGKHGEEQGVFIREVPGGCMCCAAGLPMQVALNQLITRAKPDRLLIEPTGLGHPKEVLEVLSAEHYQNVLDIQQCLTLVDARKVSDSRYTQHDTFNQQIDMADKIIGHKHDLCTGEDQQKLLGYIANRRGKNVPVSFSQHGQVAIHLLSGKSAVAANLNHHRHTHKSPSTRQPDEQVLPACGFLKVENSGEGFQSVGWRFSPSLTFNRQAVFTWLSGLKCERAKGVFITNEGVFAYNATPDALSETELGDCMESRVEIIGTAVETIHEKALMQCVEAQNASDN